MGVLLYFCLRKGSISLRWWGGDFDGCPLALCPTAQGVLVQGCQLLSEVTDLCCCSSILVLAKFIHIVMIDKLTYLTKCHSAVYKKKILPRVH